jgi:hypothetical protein
MIVSARTPPAAAATYSAFLMEFLAYLWDDLDDVAGACRHVAAAAITETFAAAVPFITAASAMLLACAAALLLAREHLAHLVA